MLFHEIYGSYYNAVAKMLAIAVEGNLTEQKMYEICHEKAFAESFIEIIPALKEEKWKLLTKDLKTPLKNQPTMPLTELQLRWLKAISLDKRIRLFNVNTDFLKDVEPLFNPDDYVIFDKYADGDPYEDEDYIKNFRAVLFSIKHKQKIAVEYESRKGNNRRFICVPVGVEYSEKDDKFRVILSGCRFSNYINMAGIKDVEILCNANDFQAVKPPQKESYFIAELIDERNALERVMLHFAHFKKEAERIDNKHYLLKIYYDESDETELVIRVLSFGPFLKVTEPQNFVNLIKERLIRQKSCELK